MIGLNPKRHGRRTGAIACFAVLTFSSSQAQSQLLTNLSIGSPKALGLANAVTADPPGVDSIHFNPAGLTRIEGRQMNLKLLLVQVDMESKFGGPINPSQDVKQAYYDVSSYCQTTYPTDGSPEQLANAYDQCWELDPVANATTASEEPVMIVPFFGVTSTPILALPTGGMAFQFNESDATFGSAVYVPEGIGYSRDVDGAGSFQGSEVALSRITYFSPTFAFRLSDDLSMGVGVNFSYQGLYLQTNFRAPTLTLKFLQDLNEIQNSPLPPIEFGPYDNVGLLSMEMEDYLSVGFNAGLLWDATPWLSLGFSYRSENRCNLEGDFSMKYSDVFLRTTQSIRDNPIMSAAVVALGGAPITAEAVQAGTVKLEYIVPQNIAFGASVKLLPALKLNLDAKWAEYSRWKDFVFEFDRNGDFLSVGTAINQAAGYNMVTPNSMTISRQYEDTWSWAIGMEYQLNDVWFLRGGFEPRTSAIPDDRADLLFPIGDAYLYTAGLGWTYDKYTHIDMALAYMYSQTKTNACQSGNANSCDEGNVVYNPYYSIPFENEVNGYLVAMSVDRKF